MGQACSEWRGDLGAYIVGALEHDAAANVRRHLRACAACRCEYEELLPVRDWLTQPGVAPRLAASRQLGGPVLTLARRPQARTGRRWLAAAVAAFVAAAVSVVAGVSGHTASSAFPAGDHATGVHGLARLDPTAEGTRISLIVTGLPADERCRLVAVSSSGTDVAATWNASYDGSARIVGTSAIPENQLTALRVESARHHLLLAISLTRRRR